MLQTISSNGCTSPENENLKALFGDVEVNGQAPSLFRILFSCLLLFDLFVYVLPHWDFLYGAEGVTIAGLAENLVYVTLGNVLGGASVGGVYWLVYLRHEE